jgi:hypothetical protein
MYKLTYLIGGVEVESYYLPNYALCRWKEKQLRASGFYQSGIFKITNV